jgi:hypothetical protein
VSSAIIVEYRGFTARPLVREYLFSVRATALEPREYSLTIPNEAFESHRARYQDAPEICSLRLHRELAAHANQLPKSHYRITDADLEDYRAAHAPPSSRPRTPKPPRQS